jgi:hypothetical protein
MYVCTYNITCFLWVDACLGLGTVEDPHEYGFHPVSTPELGNELAEHACVTRRAPSGEGSESRRQCLYFPLLGRQASNGPRTHVGHLYGFMTRLCFAFQASRNLQSRYQAH